MCYYHQVIAISCDFLDSMGFHFVAARRMLAGFERFNREIQALLHSKLPFNLRKRDSDVCGINALRMWRVRWDLNPRLSAIFTPNKGVRRLTRYPYCATDPHGTLHNNMSNIILPIAPSKSQQTHTTNNLPTTATGISRSKIYKGKHHYHVHINCNMRKGY